MSLHQYFHFKKNKHDRGKAQITIPNYVGGKIENLYPLKGRQAKSLLMVYTPWHLKFQHDNQDDDFLIDLFEKFVSSNKCPISLKNSYHQAKNSYYYDLKEPTSGFQTISTNLHEAMAVDVDASDILALTGLLPGTPDSFNNSFDQQYDMGKNHDWSKPSYKVRSVDTLYGFCMCTISTSF